jgi:hypothetical protein
MKVVVISKANVLLTSLRVIQRPKNNIRNKESSKVFVPVFWDKNGILIVNYLEKVHPSRQSTTLHFYEYTDKLKQTLVSVC